MQLRSVLFAFGLVAACAPVPDRGTAPPTIATLAEKPADPNRCWDSFETPAVIEQVNERILVQPARFRPDGSLRKPAEYRTENRTRIVTPRQARYYEIVCDKDLTPEFVASLQRALGARGQYAGPPSGDYDRATARAVRAHQADLGVTSDRVTLVAAKRLGLVVLPRPGV